MRYKPLIFLNQEFIYGTDAAQDSKLLTVKALKCTINGSVKRNIFSAGQQTHHDEQIHLLEKQSDLSSPFCFFQQPPLPCTG
jgi:hypothetical protein